MGHMSSAQVTDSHDYLNTDKSIEKSVEKDIERLAVLNR